MSIAGLVCNEGLMKCIEAMSKGGWKIYPYSFAVSDEIGELEEYRNYDSMKPTWYSAPISGRIVIDVHTIEFICTIPPQSTNDSQYIREVYILALDQNGREFLLAFGQAKGDAIYDPSGSVKLRIQISIQNVNMIDLFVFKYTQAQEIFDHNLDPNAHPDIIVKLEKMIEEHNLDPKSHPYLLVLLQQIREKIKIIDKESSSIMGITLPGVTEPSLGDTVRVIKVSVGEVTGEDQLVVSRNANGCLVRDFVKASEV